MFTTIQSDLIYFLTEYWGQAFAFATITGVLLLLCRWFYFRWKKLPVPALQGRHCYRAVLWLLFLFYLYMLASITLFSRTPSLETYCNWQLFSTFGASDWQRIFLYENILLFVPLGLLTYLLFPRVRRLYRAWLLGLCFSLLIEITQYKTHLGLFQVDDMYNNVKMTYLCRPPFVNASGISYNKRKLRRYEMSATEEIELLFMVI